ncbi:MAG: PD-(D/E)XK nuclease family protein, partial [Oscillospiraceae bacterium]
KNQEYSLSFDFFDDRLNLSPTSIEQYYKCPFQFFCDKGLNIKPLDKCELNPLEAGSLIHNALYDILKSGVLFEENYNQPKINQVIKNSLDDYIEKYMGGKEDKTDRFLYSYFRKEKTLLDISKHIFNEFKQSEFVATDLEYPITENSKEITPLIMEFDNNKSVCVTGKVDRIDLYQNENGDKYVRVIDYKTGKKEFKLSEVLYGMNLQMLLYLFMIEDNGKGKYKNCNSAGILYYPASNLTADLGRNATTDEILKIQDEFYCTNGLLLDNPKVLKAMESSNNGYYIPEKTDKKTKSFIDQKQFADISLYTKLKVKQMAQNLFMGKIPANSITCKYCNYKSVCTSKDKTDADFKPLIDKKEDVLEAIRKEVEEDD